MTHTQSALHKSKSVFFVGIGGISMSSLAEITLLDGNEVGGSDRAASDTTDALAKKGAKIVIGHYPESVRGYSLVVYTAAIPKTSPELTEAKRLGIPTLSRSEYLGELMRRYKTRIGISGTHGKTTTTTLLAHIALSTNKDPTVLNGARSSTLNGAAYRIGGKTDLFIYEACEYKASFLDFSPTTAIITGVELDHTDYYRDLSHMIDTFRASLKPAETVIVNKDDAGAMKAVEGFGGKTVSYSIKENADYKAESIRFDNGSAHFTLITKEARYPVTLPLLGSFNIENALAALAAASENGISLTEAVAALENFKAPDRRFHTVYRGELLLADDYAHHPSEIAATLCGARSLVKEEGRLITIFQSHTYTRTHDLFDDFKKALSLADLVFMPDIFAAREVNTVGVSSEKLCRAIGNKARYIESFEEIAEEVFKIARKGDVIITMGAGDVYKIGELLQKKLSQ